VSKRAAEGQHTLRDSVPPERPFLLSALPPTANQERLALVVAGSLLIACLATLPFMDYQLRREDAFIPIVDTILFLNDVITAALLYAQFSVVRRRDLLALAMGYLFTAFIIVAHLLTFPGVFTTTGLLGAGLQSTVWLYIFWHLGLPSAAIAYALLRGIHGRWSNVRVSTGRAITASLAAVILLGSALTWFSISRKALLPPIMVDAVHANSVWGSLAAPALIALSVISILLVWRRRSSVLDLWLLLVLWSWLIETLLLATTSSRFSLVWYEGRIFGLLSSVFVLLILLSQSTMLYARLALSMNAKDREREKERLTLEVIVGSIAHELKQPLTAIVANGSAAGAFLAGDPPNLSQARLAVEDIATQGALAAQMVEAIRAPLTGTARRATWIRIDQVVRETLALLRMELQTQGVDVQLQITSDLPQVWGNRSQVFQILINLITNAMESMAEVTNRPRLLTIRCCLQAQDSVEIMVQDSGTGIDPESAKRIFDPFFTTKPHGMGLGLAICRSIAEAHGGQLSVSAGDSYGSVFRLVVPRAPTENYPDSVSGSEAVVEG
jgi:signal transduction histidine kinase